MDCQGVKYEFFVGHWCWILIYWWVSNISDQHRPLRNSSKTSRVVKKPQGKSYKKGVAGHFHTYETLFSFKFPLLLLLSSYYLARRAESAENADSARRCRIAKLARRAESTENADSARRRWIAMSNPAARIYFEFWTFKIENAQEEKILGNQSFSSWKSGRPG